MIRRTPLIAASVVAVMTLALALGIAIQATGTASADVTDDPVVTDLTSPVMVQPAPTVQVDTVYLAAPEDQAMDATMDATTYADDDDDRDEADEHDEDDDDRDEADEHDEDGAGDDHDSDHDSDDDHEDDSDDD